MLILCCEIWWNSLLKFLILCLNSGLIVCGVLFCVVKLVLLVIRLICILGLVI